ncbi:hypothetical protein PVAND_014345 [Polypedilum vanderplanki]|uniref:Uncharacterized protein n=1 Tax=Polypedilum vanderplanki TaxID=319348 RepID=A0A9J6CSH1_POLVA|nr:hypothetical protein PVAND_014345 [Polypedilum vanderplanki]
MEQIVFPNAASDSYSVPPVDSYAPGNYNPSFLNQQQQQRRPPPIRPQRPIPLLQPQRQSQSQYIPPVPMKLVRPQAPPPNFRPLPHNEHAQSIAQSYSSQSHHSSHSQTIRHPPQRPPVIHRMPVPQGLLQSIGQNVQAQDNGYRTHSSNTNTYLPPPSNEIPIPPVNLVVPNTGPVQHFNSYSNSGSSGVATSSSTFSLQNNELRNVHVIHDCGKGHLPAQSYGTPLAPPLSQYIPPNESHSAVLSTSYEVPAQNFEIPQHNSVDFNSPANSYGPPASGPASSSLDVIGLESRGNSVIVEPQTAESNDAPKVELPGLSSGLSNSGLDFISATKSHTLVLPTSQSGPTRNFQLNIQSSHSDQSDNRVDLPNHHQQILADGLLNSILNAIEQPSSTVPQVSEDPEQEHKEAKKFLESKAGQEVLAEKKEH